MGKCNNNCAKIKHVMGNTLSLAIPLQDKVWRIIDGEKTAQISDFVPLDTDTVSVNIRNDNKIFTLPATVVENVVSVVDNGTISKGCYGVEIIVQRASGDVRRFYNSCEINVVEQTREAGIEDGVEFEIETHNLEAAVFDMMRGYSAYEIWLQQGHTGTEEDFLEWLTADSKIDEKLENYYTKQETYSRSETVQEIQREFGLTPWKFKAVDDRTTFPAFPQWDRVYFLGTVNNGHSIAVPDFDFSPNNTEQISMFSFWFTTGDSDIDVLYSFPSDTVSHDLHKHFSANTNYRLTVYGYKRYDGTGVVRIRKYYYSKLETDISAPVTEETVSGWGFTKNSGTITGITMNGVSKGTSGVVDLGTVLTSHQDISGKEDKVDIVSASGTTLSAEVGKYYTLSNVGTLAITLPTIAAETTKVQTVTFYIATGSSPAVTFTSTHSIYYSDGFEIAADSTYEVSAAYNGIAWVVASVKIVIPT